MTSLVAALVETPQLPPLHRILVIGSSTIQANLQQLLQPEGYMVENARGAEAQKPLRNAPPSLLILDLEVDHPSPRPFFEQIRFLYPGVPIVVLGASSSVIERVLFLELGGDDYVVKPFNPRELLARMRAVIRRSLNPRADVFSFGDVQVDFRKMEIRRQGGRVTLTAQEFKIVKFMIQHSERVLSREELLNEVWGYQNYPTTRTVDNHILRLRQKLERQPSNPVHFVTVHCVGYKFVPRSEQ